MESTGGADYCQGHQVSPGYAPLGQASHGYLLPPDVSALSGGGRAKLYICRFTPVCRATGDEKFKGSIGVAHKLSTVQRMASTAIMGALRTSASDVMEAHANMLPLELMLNKVCHRATLRLAALPETHPLFKPV